MLPEIFQAIGDAVLNYCQEKKVQLKTTKLVSDPAWKSRHLRIELLRFGLQGSTRNIPVPATLDKSLYSFTFFIIANIPDYGDCLRFTELICDHFDKKPFLQLKLNEQEFEIAIFSMELTIGDLNQFWLAQNQPHQPVLFYQARISET